MGGCDVDVCDFLCGFFGLMYANRDPSEDDAVMVDGVDADSFDSVILYILFQTRDQPFLQYIYIDIVCEYTSPLLLSKTVPS